MSAEVELLKQFRVAVAGCPDAGKSTFIGSLVKAVTGRVVSTDTLMKEVHWSDGRDPMGNPDTRTIKCAKIMFQYGGYEYCMYDCPGHIEYSSQIAQGLEAADCIVHIVNSMDSKDKSEAYMDCVIADAASSKPVLTLNTHTGQCCSRSPVDMSYDSCECSSIGFLRDVLMPALHSLCCNKCVPHDIEEEALYLVKECVPENCRSLMLFSGGKDSVVGLHLYSMANRLENTTVLYPRSGYDFPEVEKHIYEVCSEYNIVPVAFDNSGGLKYGEDSVFSIMEAKASANENVIAAMQPDIVAIQYRASDEGVRSKDYHLSERNGYSRFSPVFYFSESNIWRFILKHGLKVCPLYMEGYRSLGDAPVTTTCMPVMKTVEELIAYIDGNTRSSERDGRKLQDNSEQFAMEKLRNIGFF